MKKSEKEIKKILFWSLFDYFLSFPFWLKKGWNQIQLKKEKAQERRARWENMKKANKWERSEIVKKE